MKSAGLAATCPVVGSSLARVWMARAAGVLRADAVEPCNCTRAGADADMMNPAQGGFAPPDKSLLRKTADNVADDDTLRRNARAPSRIGAIPTYGIPPASGAAEVGFDSLNRTRKKPKLYPGAPKPKIVGPGNPPAAAPKAKVAAPVSQSVAGTFPGQPQRRRLKLDDDPFANVGFHTGTFLTKAAVELWGGYNTNPGRITTPKGSAFYTVAPELLIASDWERHSLGRRSARLVHRL